MLIKFVSNWSMHAQLIGFSSKNVIHHVCPLFVCSELSLKTALEYVNTT